MRTSLLLAFLAALLGSVPAYAQSDDVEFFAPIHVTPERPVQDAVCFFCSIDVDGTANGDIVAFFGPVRLNGQARHDVVAFFGPVRVEDNSSVAEDLVSFFGPVHLGENVTVGKDLVTFFGPLRMQPSAHIGGDLVHFPGIVLFVPPLVVLAIVFFVVYEVRRRHLPPAGYPPASPPMP